MSALLQTGTGECGFATSDNDAGWALRPAGTMLSPIPDRTALNWKRPLEVRALLPLVGLQSGLDLVALGDLLFIKLLLNLIRGAHRENAVPGCCLYWLPAE